MSVVTDVIVTCSIMDDDLLEKLNAELEKLPGADHVKVEADALARGGQPVALGGLECSKCGRIHFDECAP